MKTCVLESSSCDSVTSRHRSPPEAAQSRSNIHVREAHEELHIRSKLISAQSRITSSVYLQRLHLILQSLVLGLQVLHAVLGLAQLGFQLGLQLPAALLELQQLLLGLLAAVGGGRRGGIRQPVQTERGVFFPSSVAQIPVHKLIVSLAEEEL